MNKHSGFCQLQYALWELAVWLAPVIAVWFVATVALTILATPWTRTPTTLTIGFGVVIGTAFAVYYANQRLTKLSEIKT